MKSTNYLIILLSLLCLVGCKFDGSLMSEKYEFDSSNAMRISVNGYSYSLMSDDSPKIESVIINYAGNSEIDNVIIKLQGKSGKRYDASILDRSHKGYAPNIGNYLSGQWKAFDEYNTIIGGEAYDILRIMDSPDICPELDEKFIDEIHMGYLKEYYNPPYLICVKEGHYGNGTWYVYPVIKKQERRNIDLIPEKKSYFNK